MKTYTIVRNGTIRTAVKGKHYCGYGHGKYSYRVTMTVKGKLQGPDYFIVANEEMNDWIQEAFVGRPTMSCERMCDIIIDETIATMKTKYPHWRVLEVKAELTGTNGLALLSCTWNCPKRQKETV